MRGTFKRGSIAVRLTVFLAIWTAGTLGVVAGYYAWIGQQVSNYNAVLAVLTVEAQKFHRILDNPAPLGSAGRELFRSTSDLVDNALQVLRDGGRFQTVEVQPIPVELGGLLDEIEMRWRPTQRAVRSVLEAAEADESAARRHLHRFFPNFQADVQRMQRSLVRREGTIREHSANTLAVIGVGNVVFLAAVLWLVRRFIIRPVRAVHAAASRVASGDFSTPVPVRGSDEIGELATEFNRMSAQLQESMTALKASAEEISRANKELEEYAYAAAHDLQEPSRVVTLYAQLLRRRCALTPDGAQLAAQIETSAERMLRIVNDLLLHSKSAHEPTRSTISDAHRAATEAVVHHEEAIARSGAKIVVGLMPQVLANEADLELIFRNLIGNSLKYRSEAAPEIAISSEVTGGICIFRVSDNGIGIAPEYHERVFGLFKRLHGQDIPGHGVGLAITKKLVEKHGGRIWVESEAGKGAAFAFELRVAESAVAASGGSAGSG